jgi:hypothetical protein
VYTFYSTSPSGIQLFRNTTYWLYNFMTDIQLVLHTEVPPNAGGPIALGVYYYFGWTSTGLSTKVSIMGCPGLIPPPSPSPSVAPSRAPAVSPVSRVRSNIDPNDPVASLFKESERLGTRDASSLMREFSSNGTE